MDTTLVISTMQGLANDIKEVITQVAPFGISIMAVFLGFRYGKRIFFSLSK